MNAAEVGDQAWRLILSLARWYSQGVDELLARLTGAPPAQLADLFWLLTAGIKISFVVWVGLVLALLGWRLLRQLDRYLLWLLKGFFAAWVVVVLLYTGVMWYLAW